MNSNQDIEHLRLLSIFHYVAAGLLAVFSMFPIIHLIIGIAMVTGQFEDGGRGDPPPEIFGWIFILIPAMFIVCGLVMACCVAIAGQRLGQYRSYTFCLVIAAIECMFMPIGTILGVFTIIVLVWPTVKELFEGSRMPGDAESWQR